MDCNRLEIHIDDRERKIIPFFETCDTKNFVIITKRLTVGDYAYVYDDQIIVIIERKSWSDLASSIKDGRKENIHKMIDVRNQTQCKLVYLIEGKAFYKPNKKICRMPFKALRSHLDHLAIRDNVIIIHSSDYEDTADRIINFAENICTLDLHIICPNADTKDQCNLLTTPRPKTDSHVTLLIWKSISGITNTSYSFISAQYSLQDFITNSVDYKELCLLKYPSGQILGESKAKKIIHSARSDATYIKMLSRIPGITLETGRIINNSFSLSKIVSGKVTIKQLSLIDRKTRKVGIAIAKHIHHYFVPLPSSG